MPSNVVNPLAVEIVEPVVCAPGKHKFGTPTGWEHPVGTGTAYRHRTCGTCGHVETEGMGLTDPRLDITKVTVTGSERPPESVSDALKALTGGK